ncbi:isochorismatase family protein [Caulobacter endophyticus]|uniref:Isochorismatase n=1 Tax=Caulobacter endophyticus TaxID=2172652 RepID=A0A2T9K9S5_9CAUL|nr:isochorismatase family protein [Caulobacter endophyticus]PVM92715.1 isochorismatase [Caulobacter endophyticus]
MSFEPFTAQNAVMLLVDHQVGTIAMVGSTDPERLKRNVVMLAQVARILDLPVILTSSMEDQAQGPLVEDLPAILPAAHAARIKRRGVINAVEDPAVARAIQTTGRKKIILAGVTNDVCTVLPALSLVGDRFTVQVVADAGGSPTLAGDELALRRMEQAGVLLAGTNQMVAELVGDWSTPQGQEVIKLIRSDAG